MRSNESKRKARNDQLVLGTMCNAASPLIGEWLGHSGYDFVVVDLQHGENSLATVQVMMQALSSTPATPIVRVAANEPVSIQRVLDLGAYGVIVPMVNTAEQAAAAVSNVRYAPQGQRSFGPLRGAIYGGPDYFSRSAEELLTLVMIETAEGLANLDAILAVDGVDGCFVGPADLNISLGHSPETMAAQTQAAIARIATATRKANKIAAAHTTGTADARLRIEQGFRLLTVMADTRLIRAGATECLQALRS